VDGKMSGRVVVGVERVGNVVIVEVGRVGNVVVVGVEAVLFSKNLIEN
jgi:hypothetical protein